VKKSKLWIVISLVLVFAAGVVGGILSERWILGRRPETRRSGQPHFPSLERWAKDLNLTAEQQEKIKNIFKKNEERIKQLRTDFYKHLGEIREQLKSEVDAVLTPEQRQKLETMIQKHLQERRKEYEKRDRESEPRNKENSNKESANEKESDHRSGSYSGGRDSHSGVWPF
jgi:Spy/CpxP family protein refolding chaperone